LEHFQIGELVVALKQRKVKGLYAKGFARTKENLLRALKEHTSQQVPERTPEPTPPGI
jgi:hypothetical protein